MNKLTSDLKMSKETLFSYVRVSSQEQDLDGNSLTVQSDWGNRVAKKLDMKSDVTTYAEGVRSSTTQFRPKLEKLEDDIRKGIVKHLWVLDVSRIFRSGVEWGLFVSDYLIPHEVKVYIGTFGETFDLENDDTLMILDIIARVKENQVKTQSLKSRQGKIYKLENESKTKPVFLGGTPLFGYDTKDKLWKINKEESKWVKFIFDSYENGISSKDIKGRLDREGIQPRRTRDGLWNLGTLQDMLKNKSYTGEHLVWEHKRVSAYEYKENIDNAELGSDDPIFVNENSVGGRNIYDKRGKVLRKKVRPFTYPIPRIITKGQYNRVQKIIQKNIKFHPNNNQHFSLLQNLLECECGNNIGSRVDYRTRPNGTIVNTRKYMCPSVEYDWKTGTGRKCRNIKSLQMDAMNEYVTDLVKDRVGKSNLLKENFKRDVLEDVKKKTDIKEREKDLEKKVQSVIKDIDSMETSIVELEFEIRTDKMGSKRGATIIQRFQKELEIKKDQKSELEKEIDDLGKDRMWLDWVGKYGEDIKVKMSSETKQKEFLQGILDKIVVSSEYENDKQIGHSFSFHFRMEIVNDKFEWIDKTVRPNTYKVTAGKKVDNKSGMVKLVAIRPSRKKKDLLTSDHRKSEVTNNQLR